MFLIKQVGTDWYARLDPFNGWQSWSKEFATTFSHKECAEQCIQMFKYVDGLCSSKWMVIEAKKEEKKEETKDLYVIKHKIFSSYAVFGSVNRICDWSKFVGAKNFTGWSDTQCGATFFDSKEDALNALDYELERCYSKVVKVKCR